MCSPGELTRQASRAQITVLEWRQVGRNSQSPGAERGVQKVPAILQEFKRQAPVRPDVKAAYDRLGYEFAFLDALLKVRPELGFTQGCGGSDRNHAVRDSAA